MTNNLEVSLFVMLHQLGIPTATVCLSTANSHILQSRVSASGAAINSKFFVGFTGVLEIPRATFSYQII